MQTRIIHSKTFQELTIKAVLVEVCSVDAARCDFGSNTRCERCCASHFSAGHIWSGQGVLLLLLLLLLPHRNKTFVINSLRFATL